MTENVIAVIVLGGLSLPALVALWWIVEKIVSAVLNGGDDNTPDVFR